jgi:hypothetical protein
VLALTKARERIDVIDEVLKGRTALTNTLVEGGMHDAKFRVARRL